ncbi:MAG: ABC transporter permease [Gemmataceae bacterium]
MSKGIQTELLPATADQLPSSSMRPSSPPVWIQSRWLNNAFLRDYGMIFVLLLLGLVFSVLTLKQQYPISPEAGREVANSIVEEHGSGARVIVVGRATLEDERFVEAIAERLQSNDAKVLATINGTPADVRKAIELALANEGTIDVIATNNVTRKWPVYDRFPTVGSSKCVSPDSYTWPDFLKSSNLIGVANKAAIYAILAIGMTMVIITRGIDLSVGSLVALSSVVGALVMADYGAGRDKIEFVLLACVAGIGVSGLAGAYHGLLVTAFRVPAFVVTLGMMLMARGLSRWLSDGQSISNLPNTFLELGGGKMFGVPNPVLVMVFLYGVSHVVMSRTVFGRYVYAIGGNEEAARLSGVPVRWVLVIVYTICGALAGLGGLLLASQLGAGDPKFGVMYELEVIAAVVVGGTSLMGGQGKIFGTLIGALIIAVITNGMNLVGVDPDSQLIVLGGVLTGAVLFDAVKRRRIG